MDAWDEHFYVEESGLIIGSTPIGRTTAYVLGMNANIRIQIRREIARLEAAER